jgi:glucose-1-phosphate cytidylyltransferase
MKVVILCGGMGTRLREETEFRPKPMIEIGGRPILWHIMKIYAYHGHTDFILCLGYKGWMIKEYFLNYEAMNNDFTIRLGSSNEIRFHSNHSENGWTITLADTGLMTITGARVKRIEKYINDDEFMLTYGDGVADININHLIEFHRSHGKIGTVTGARPPSRFGELIVNGDSVVEFSEKPHVSHGYINGGFFVFNRDIFNYLSTDDSCTLEREPLEKLAKDGELMMYHHTGFWQCIDTYRDLQLIRNLWESGKAYWKIWE